MNDTIAGNLHVANDVLADMVGNAALECYGVVGMAAPNAADGIAKILPASRLRRGVVVTTTEVGVHVELYVVIEYGTNINGVAEPRRPSDVRVERVRSRSARRRRGARAGREGAQVARPPCHDEPLPARREGRRRSAA